MKQFGKRSFGMALAAAALLLSCSSGAYAYRISAWPDSVFMTTTVGSSTYGYVYISDGRDTMVPNQTPGTVYISMTQSGTAFTMQTDSVLDFVGEGYIRIRYSPTNLMPAVGQLTIRSDSSTVYITLVGEPLADHHTPRVFVGNYDSLALGRLTCEAFSLENPNSDTLVVTGVTVRDQRNGNVWTLDNLVTFPLDVPAGSTVTLGDLCAELTRADSGWDQGALEIRYSYAGSPDSTGIGLYAQGLPINTQCVLASNGDLGDVTAGETVSKTITLTNTTDSSIYLYNAHLSDSNYWTLGSSPFPVVVPKDSSVSVGITLTVPGNAGPGNLYQTLYVSVSGSSPDAVPCSSVSVSLSATLQLPVVDSITLEVPAGSTSLSISQRVNPARHAIFIHNSGSNRLLVESLSAFSNDTGAFPYFDGFGNTSARVNDSLEANAWFGPIYLTLYTLDSGTYDLSLTLSYSVQQAGKKGVTPQSNSQTYSIIAHQLPAASAGVSEPNAPAPVDFTLSPNPARDAVTIGLPNDGSSNVEIYDVLGNLVFQGAERGSFVWNGTANGSPVANGTYIVRVSQGSRVGSERLVFVR